MVYPVLKRLFDIFFSALGLLFVAPLLLLVALVMKLTDSGPVFYRQARIGRFGVPFQIWKIRTMVAGAETLGPLITQAKDPRMTRIGRLLRKAKIDELPQFWNVLKGEMSFVGPRPQVPRFIERLTPAQRAMLQHRPGITDMATVKFRNEQELLSGAADMISVVIRSTLLQLLVPDHLMGRVTSVNAKLLRLLCESNTIPASATVPSAHHGAVDGSPPARTTRRSTGLRSGSMVVRMKRATGPNGESFRVRTIQSSVHSAASTAATPKSATRSATSEVSNAFRNACIVMLRPAGAARR